jgi:hypothetical protein
VREERKERADRRVRARLGQQVDAQAGDRAVSLQTEVHELELAATLDHRDHVLAAGLGPLHRAAERERRLPRNDELDLEGGLRAETATHRSRADAHVRRIETKRARQLSMNRVRRLRRDPGRETVAFGDDDDPIRLHRHTCKSLVDEPARHHDLGVVHETLDRRAHAHTSGTEDDVGPHGVVQERRTVANRGFEVDDGRQRVVVDDHRFGGVGRLLTTLGDDRRDDVADETDLAFRERRTVRRRRQHDEALMFVEFEVRRGVDGQHTWHRFCFARVDGPERCVCDGAAHEHDVRHASDVEVVEVLGLPRENPRVLLAEHGIAENRTLETSHAPTLAKSERLPMRRVMMEERP